MDSSLISGPMMSLIGVVTVFVVLVSLVSAVSLMRRLFGAVEASAPVSQATAPDSQALVEVASDGQPDGDLLLLALAAYSYHRSRRASASAPAQATEWSQAGRIRQIASFRR